MKTSDQNFTLKNESVSKKHKHLKMNTYNQNDEDDFIASATVKSDIDVNSKHKKSKKKRTLHFTNKDSDNTEEGEELCNSSNDLSVKKDHNQQVKLIKNKKKMLDSTNEDYKPGMLSDSIQIKKYGRIIIPWDPSFGLDESYTIPVNVTEDFPKLKMNPLFNMSRRKEIASQPIGDKNQRTIFVGNLPCDCQISEIKKLFKKCGLIHQIKMKDKRVNKSFKEDTRDKNSHKNAFITFKKVESCEKALKFNGNLFRNCHLRVDKAQNTNKSETRRSVFVGNLAFKTEDEDLWKSFASCGEIEAVRIIRDKSSGTGKAYGYVNFKTEEAVENAIELDGLSILGRNVRVSQYEVGALQADESIVKRKRSKKRTSAHRDTAEENVQESNYEITKDEIEPKEKKVKKKKPKEIKLQNNESKQIKVSKKSIDKKVKEVDLLKNKIK